MGLLEIGAGALAALFLLVIIGRLRHSPGSLGAGPAREVREIGGSVGSFVAAANRCEREDEPAYAAAVDALSNDPSASAMIEQSYRDASPGLKPVLLLAAAAAGSGARRFLSETASTPIGEMSSVDAAVEESRLRLTAVDGLERLGRAGDIEAWQDLERLASSADRAVQMGAVAALKFGGQDEAVARLRRLLPADRRFLFDITRPDVRDVPHVVDPRRHLAGREMSTGTRPPLNGGLGVGADRRQSSRGAPIAQETTDG